MSSTPLPSREQLKAELVRVRKRDRTLKALNSTLGILVVVAALAVFLSFAKLPLLEMTGESMSPTMQPGEYVLAERGAAFETGDVIAFHYNSKVLVKRVVAVAGQWVDMDEYGNVYVDGQMLEEPYLKHKTYGNVDIEFPYQVPEGSVFVLGDNRDISLDSRTKEIGCIYDEQVVGKVLARAWPLSKLGFL